MCACIQCILDADAHLQHVALLKDLCIGDLAEMVKCRPLANGIQSMITHLIRFLANLGEDVLDGRHKLLDMLELALSSHQRS